MKLASIVFFFVIASAGQSQEVSTIDELLPVLQEKGGCPRRRDSCHVPEFPPSDCNEPENRDFCSCPRGTILIGSFGGDFLEGTGCDQTNPLNCKAKWGCAKLRPDCGVKCKSGHGYRGFCVESFVTLPKCRIPSSVFAEAGINQFNSDIYYLTADKDGFYVIQAEDQNSVNSRCAGCHDGYAKCLKRIPYAEFQAPPTVPKSASGEELEQQDA